MSGFPQPLSRIAPRDCFVAALLAMADLAAAALEERLRQFDFGLVIPAQAGIQGQPLCRCPWTPASAGVTRWDGSPGEQLRRQPSALGDGNVGKRCLEPGREFL